MADIHTVNFNGTNGSHFYMSMKYDLSQDTSRNQSTITYYLYVGSTDGYSGSGATATGYINNEAVGTFNSIGVNAYFLVGSKTETYTHNADGTKTISYSFLTDTNWTLGDASWNGTITLPRIDRYATMIDAISNPNDESDFWFKYTNPRNLTMIAWLEVNPVSTWIAQRTITNAGTSGTYTWELTEEEREQLRARIPNKNSGKLRIGIKSTISGTENNSYIDRTFTIVNGNPIFSDYTIADINPTTVALTGSTTNDVINVNGYSNIQATITTNDIAEAIKSASMSKYRFKIGDSSTDIAYSSEEVVNGTINNASTGIYEMYAIDSRNNSTLITKQATSIINYEKISLNKQNCSFVRDDNQVGENAILTINGTFWNDNFGQASNSLSVSYRLKKSDSSTWITGTTTITPTISGNSFTFTGMIASDNVDTTWDLDSSYNLEVIVSDELSSASVELILNSAAPTMSLDKNGVGILCAYDSNLGGSLQVNGKVIDGGTLLWTNNSPSSSFGSQTITLSESLDDYDCYEIIFRQSTTDVRLMTTGKIPVGSGTIMSWSTSLNFYRPTATTVSGNTITFEEGKNTNGTDNNRTIPIYIIAYKIGLFS